MKVLCCMAACVLGGQLWAAPEPKVEMSVQLPPFIIEQAAGPKWRYTRIPRFEILSRCNDLTTEQLALAFHRANQFLGLVLPEHFQIKLDVPQALIFYDEKLWPIAEQQAVAAMLKAHPPARADGLPPSGALPRVRLEPITGAKWLGPEPTAQTTAPDSFFSNLMLSDADSITTFALVSASTLDPQRSYLTPAYVANLLEQRTPALPDWFTTGFLRLYERMEFQDNTVTVRPIRWFFQNEKPSGTKIVAPEPDLIPPAVFFAGKQSPDYDAVTWLAQSELFASWGLDPAQDRAKAFWKFVERTATEPVTESAFAECFGLDWARAWDRLAAHATHHPGLRWTLPAAFARPPADPVEDATPRQIARLKGEWERLEAHYVRKNQPDLEEHYVTLARRTLRKPYDRGDRDPRLLASLGLLELDAGNKAEAIPLLEQAVQAGVIRPRAYYEIARLRYDALVGRSTRNDGKFTAEQVAPVVEPLLAGMKQSPPLAAAYELLAHITTQSVAPPSEEVVTSLAEGARLFPQKSDRLLKPAMQARLLQF
ncbi:hypothetical protein ESB00_06085 [Oleiharenicola lentus]|uniref:Tetratricopeptide repeat protein n=1 Tax=Oleiharenicola lentus TaxID=2508720 RepID=A0A4Q1C912_9BACT|nr:hypothetical protein ESB00_06085 [Oleiharenicola lentus]